MELLGRWTWYALLPAVAVIATWIALRNIDAFAFRTDTGYLLTVGDVGRAWWFRVGFFLHVFAAVPVVFIGWGQFSGWLLRRHARWHRALGKAYVGLIVFGAAPGGLLIAFGAAGGWAGRVCFVVMSVLWAFFTVRAWVRARRRDFRGHQADMRRSYALSFAAITLRVWMFLIGGLLAWRSPEAYALCAWLCWVPNLVLLELWNWARKV